MASTIETDFNRTQWKALTSNKPNGSLSLYGSFLVEADRHEGGTRTAWALNLMSTLCRKMCGTDDPRDILCDQKTIRVTFNEVTHNMSQQLRRKGLFLIRQMLATTPECTLQLESFPRRLQSAPDPMTRQRCKVYEDILPTKVAKAWMLDVLRVIIDHPVASKWKTSASAHQSVAKAHRVLRTMGCWNDAMSQADFEACLYTMTPANIEDMFDTFACTLCNTPSNVKTYLATFNMLFHDVFHILPEKLKHRGRYRRTRTLAELEDRKSVV